MCSVVVTSHGTSTRSPPSAALTRIGSNRRSCGRNVEQTSHTCPAPLLRLSRTGTVPCFSARRTSVLSHSMEKWRVQMTYSRRQGLPGMAVAWTCCVHQPRISSGSRRSPVASERYGVVVFRLVRHHRTILEHSGRPHHADRQLCAVLAIACREWLATSSRTS